MKCTVTYDCWQMECCGTPFSVGDTVKWFVKAYDTVERERSDILSDSLKTYFDNWKQTMIMTRTAQTGRTFLFWKEKLKQ